MCVDEKVLPLVLITGGNEKYTNSLKAFSPPLKKISADLEDTHIFCQQMHQKCSYYGYFSRIFVQLSPISHREKSKARKKKKVSRIFRGRELSVCVTAGTLMRGRLMDDTLKD